MLTIALLAASLQGGAIGGNTPAYEQSFRKSYRERAVKQCVTKARNAPARIDVPTVCGCVADHQLATKTVAQLQKKPARGEFRPIIAQCLREHPPK
ncbi:MAG: hypothetical protein P0Y64_14435 [Candidatus Sphingomonas colombiensis]|nr:hypothetical protein [Sphingomonas sp.]WEK42572.1 MAG: hypothetical protein P0Y64_14435 [Sphingomonas sp.]